VRLLAAAGCALAAAAMSGCNAIRPYAYIVCELNGGDLISNGYGAECRPKEAGATAHARPSGGGGAASFRATLRAATVRRPAVRGGGVRGIVQRGRIRFAPARGALRGLGRGRFRSRADVRVGGRNGLGRIGGHMAIRFRRRDALCLRVDGFVTDIDGVLQAQVYFRSSGGTGRGARVRVRGQAPYGTGAGRVRGTLEARRGRAKRPARACGRLLARIPRRA
jgi:hypothetical protein